MDQVFVLLLGSRDSGFGVGFFVLPRDFRASDSGFQD